jgi:hypothetical protein
LTDTTTNEVPAKIQEMLETMDPQEIITFKPARKRTTNGDPSGI